MWRYWRGGGFLGCDVERRGFRGGAFGERRFGGVEAKQPAEGAQHFAGLGRLGQEGHYGRFGQQGLHLRAVVRCFGQNVDEPSESERGRWFWSD